MNGEDKNFDEPPKEYSAEHFDDPLQQQIKVPWYKKLLQNKKMLFIIGAAVAAILIVILIVALSSGGGSYSGERVFLEIEGPDSVADGSQVTYRINAVNKEAVDIRDVEIELIFPQGFSYTSSSIEKSEDGNVWNLGSIEENYSSDFEVSGILSGSASELKIVKGVMRFTPADINSDFSVEAEASTIISAGNILLTIDAPQTSASGNDVEYKVRYENRGNENEKGWYIRLNYPRGFEYSKAEPAPDEDNNIWKLPDLESGEQGEINISGILRGADSEVEKVVAELGTMDADGSFKVQLSKEDSTRIVESAVVIEENLLNDDDSIIDTGEELDFVVSYENLGSVGLRNVEIEVTFSNPDIIDFSEFQAKGGAYSDGKIIWNSSGVPELALVQPNTSGDLEFSLKIKDRLEIPIESVADKNFMLKTLASIRSDDIPLSISAEHKVDSEPLNLKLNSFITVNTQGLYYDQFSGEPIGSGPMPPRVGEKTTYRIMWEVTNLANDLSDARVSVVLAPGASFSGNTNVTHGQDIRFDPKTSTIIWDIGRVPANTGSLGEKMLASFDVSVIPGDDKIGGFVDLLQETLFSATDDFTGAKLQGTDEALTSELPDDKFAEDKGKVQP